MNNYSFICKCKRCGHKWWPRGYESARCPKCQSKQWDKPDARTGKELEDFNSMKFGRIRG